MTTMKKGQTMRYPEGDVHQGSEPAHATDRRPGGSWLWTLLHAHALIDGTIGTCNAAAIEDDCRRLAGRRTR
jgi:hypothetical protein